MKRRLVILAGAHKTASSHIQHSLLGSSDALRVLGIAVVGPKPMRRDLTPLSQLLRDGVTAQVVRGGADGFLDHYGGNADTIVLMDENILGGTDRKMLMRKTRLYPWGARRLARLAQLFEGHRIELGLAVRNPATFLPSCWSESLLHGRYDDFQSFVQGFDTKGEVWSGLIDRIAEACQDTPITLWRYEDYSAFGTSLFDHLLKPGAAQAVKMDPETRRAGLSHMAAEWFQAQGARDKDTVQEARRRYPKVGPETAYAPWPEDERQALAQSYETDLAQLRARAGVTLLYP